MGNCFSSSPSPARRRRPARKSGLKRDELSKISGRFSGNGGLSRVASLFSMQGKKGINQDAMIVWENFGSRDDTVFCGVFDGHGPYGRMVARRVRDVLPLQLSSSWEVNVGSEEHGDSTASIFGGMSSEESARVSVDEKPSFCSDSEEKDEQLKSLTALKNSFLEAFKVMDKELKLHQGIDCFCSGTTAVTLIQQGQHIVIGNLGDSRAVLGTRDENDCLKAVQLTVDLKPSLPGEAERIRRRRGRVFALRDEPDVARVWLPNSNSPGLAMARAFGDFCLISTPEVTHSCITERDEFIVLATDGVWDVLSNKEVVTIVASASARSIAARFLVESAVRAWRYKYPTAKIDDCAVVCLFLNVDAADSSSNLEKRVAKSVYTDRESNVQESSYSMSLDVTIRSDTDIIQDGASETL